MVIKDNFDTLALHSQAIAPWDHNVHFHTFLLQHVPTNAQIAVDIGCGTGEFSRLLSPIANAVIGFDLSPNMTEMAREYSTSYDNINYDVYDIAEYEFQDNSIDCLPQLRFFITLTTTASYQS